MRPALVAGILNEFKAGEQRAPLTPADVAWLKERFIDVEVQTSAQRIFPDRLYEEAGARIVDQLDKAELIIGIKEPDAQNLQDNKIYLCFSHTIKGQPENMALLRQCIEKNITLVDYEKIVDSSGRRLVYFGNFAGICGAIDALCFLGQKYHHLGFKSPFHHIKPAHEYASLVDAKTDIKKADILVREKGLDGKICPFIIGITGRGNVCSGIKEILDIFNPINIHPRDMKRFVENNARLRHKVCVIVFDREEKLRSISGEGFYFEEYLENPKEFESNLDHFLPHINLLFHSSYWDIRYPRLVTKSMIHTIWNESCRLQFIADISCDVNGSIEITHQTTDEQNPTYTYDPRSKKYTSGHLNEGIAVLARDNLPSELPADASRAFSTCVKEYIYQIAAHGILDITHHVAIPKELRNAVICQDGKLLPAYEYLQRFLLI